jgi:hypothetical protein
MFDHQMVIVRNSVHDRTWTIKCGDTFSITPGPTRFLSILLYVNLI